MNLGRATQTRFRFRRWLRSLIASLLTIIVIWIVGDFIYSRVTQSHLDKWESTIEREFDGVQFDHREFEVGQGSTALLMVHGINDSPSAFKKMASVLSAEGFFCRAIRLPGFAKPNDEYARGKSEQWVKHVYDEVIDLKRSHENVFIVAHSLGGATTIQMQLRYRAEIDGLILLAPAIEVSSIRSPLLPTRTWHEIGKRALMFTKIVENPFTIDAKDKFEAMRKDRNRFSPISVIDETFKLIDANRGRAKDIKVPTLMALTRNDRVIDHTSCESFFEELGSTNKQLFYNDRAGHALPYDYGWENVTDRVAEFVDEVLETKKQIPATVSQ